MTRWCWYETFLESNGEIFEFRVDFARKTQTKRPEESDEEFTRSGGLDYAGCDASSTGILYTIANLQTPKISIIPSLTLLNLPLRSTTHPHTRKNQTHSPPNDNDNRKRTDRQTELKPIP